MKNCGKSIAGKVRNEASFLIHQSNHRLKDIIEDNGKPFRSFVSIFQQAFRQRSEARHVHEHRESLKTALFSTGKELGLYEMWN